MWLKDLPKLGVFCGSSVWCGFGVLWDVGLVGFGRWVPVKLYLYQRT